MIGSTIRICLLGLIFLLALYMVGTYSNAALVVMGLGLTLLYLLFGKDK